MFLWRLLGPNELTCLFILHRCAGPYSVSAFDRHQLQNSLTETENSVQVLNPCFFVRVLIQNLKQNKGYSAWVQSMNGVNST